MLIQTLLLCTMSMQDTTSIADALQEVAAERAAGLIDLKQEGLPKFHVLRPKHMGKDDVGPVLLALPPGDQSQAMVNAGYNLYWREDALRLGWTVISPLAPEGELLRGDNLRLLHALIDHVEATYKIEGGKLHLAGVSNGGRSAFELALDRPERFASLSLLPGMPDALGFEKLESLVHLPLAMYVGGTDKAWREPMERVDAGLRALGAAPVRFRIYEGEGHTPESLDGKTLFHTLEAFRVRGVLADFHDAASKADGPRYFAHFAPGSIFIGTDASERWTLEAFRAFAEPYFSKGRGWTYVASERHTFVAEDGQSAWFDELLDNASYGVTRGTGVLVRGRDRWRLAQYHLTIPVPNELAAKLVELIRAEDD